MYAQPGIFIGYRRSDTADVAGRMYDRLCGDFGRNFVFKDVDNLPVGEDFDAAVARAIAECSFFLPLIGPGWLDARNDQGALRLQDPGDLVRREIELALMTPSVQVIPILVNGAEMPRPETLPNGIQRLSALNAAKVRQDPDFHLDLDRLVRELKGGSAGIGARTGFDADVLHDLRETWRAFPAKHDLGEVELFLLRVRAVGTQSGLEFEVERHLTKLQEEAERNTPAWKAREAGRKLAQEYQASLSANEHLRRRREQDRNGEANTEAPRDPREALKRLYAMSAKNKRPAG